MVVFFEGAFGLWGCRVKPRQCTVCVFLVPTVYFPKRGKKKWRERKKKKREILGPLALTTSLGPKNEQTPNVFFFVPFVFFVPFFSFFPTAFAYFVPFPFFCPVAFVVPRPPSRPFLLLDVGGRKPANALQPGGSKPRTPANLCRCWHTMPRSDLLNNDLGGHLRMTSVDHGQTQSAQLAHNPATWSWLCDGAPATLSFSCELQPTVTSHACVPPRGTHW